MNASFTIGEFLLYALLGLVTVFAVLAFLMLVIKLISLIPDKKNAADTADVTCASASTTCAASTTTADASSAATRPTILAPGSAGDINLYDTDPRDAAMIMAIVADELGKPLNELRFISIREVQQ